MDVYAKQSTASTYTYLGATDPFTVTGYAVNDAYGLRFYNFGHGYWDFQVIVRTTSDNLIWDTYNKLDDSDMGNMPLELDSEDL
jgi:hypothetical protein